MNLDYRLVKADRDFNLCCSSCLCQRCSNNKCPSVYTSPGNFWRKLVRFDLSCSKKKGEKNPKKSPSHANWASDFGQQCLFVNAECWVSDINRLIKDDAQLWMRIWRSDQKSCCVFILCARYPAFGSPVVIVQAQKQSLDLPTFVRWNILNFSLHMLLRSSVNSGGWHPSSWVKSSCISLLMQPW